MHHDLKIHPAFMEPVLAGTKTFEIRDGSDRDFNAGDTVTLKEFTNLGGYTGREHRARIGFVSNFGQQDGYVVFSLLPR